MSFEDIKDQPDAVRQLAQSLKSGNIAHSYIFAGPAGSGRKRAAAVFAKALNCSRPDASAGPCGRCRDCGKIDASNHPDVSVITPEKPGKEMGIDRIRQMASSLYLKCYEGRTKVMIVDCDNGVSAEAANAFLKTLEEPPERSVIVLIAGAAASLLPTIVSRSRVVNFRAPRRAPADEKRQARRRDIISALREGRAHELDFDGVSRQEACNALVDMLAWYRDVMAAKAGVSDSAYFFNPDEKRSLVENAAAYDFGRLDAIMAKIVYTRSCLEQDANVKLAMAAMAAQLAS